MQFTTPRVVNNGTAIN